MRFDNRRAKGLAIFKDLSGSTSILAGGTGSLSGNTGQTQMTINNATPTAVAISGLNTVEVGKEIQLTATGTFDDMTMHDVTLASGWSIDTGAATVLAGRVKGVTAGGMVTVTARYDNGLTDTHMISVTSAP